MEKRQSVIIFDEVQEFPKARQAIKTLVEDKRYDYIETGSLISIRRRSENIIIPSEETRIEMYPMDYEEFRWALGDETTAAGSKLFYHMWPTESGKHNYEVDFILSRGAKIWPLEVKSSGYKTHASIDAFCEKFSDRVSERFLVYTKDLRKDGATTLLPVMMTMFL